MSPELANEIERLLIAIEETQQQLALLYRSKRAAIRQANAPELTRLTEQEHGLVAQLQAQLRERHAILQRAAAMGKPADSLEALVRSLAPPQRDPLLLRIERTRQAADANRRESWVVWIVSRQSLRLFGDILDLIAHGGRKAPVYSVRSEADISFGGALLDASA